MTQSSGKFWLIAAGTSKFDDPSWDALEEVPDEIALITNFFQEIGYVRVLAEISINSKRQDFGKALRSWCTSVERKPSDRVVIYYTGHGERADRHYLAFSDSSGPSNLYSSGYAVEDLIRDVLYQTPIQNLMLLLDTCYAGAGIEDALSLASGANAQKDQRVSTHVYFMASATPIQKARERRFAQAFTQAARNADGLTDLGLSEYLHPDKLVQRVNALMKGQSARGSSANVSAEPIFIPNLRRKALLDIYRSDLETHWIPRLRGTEQQAGAWYFTGRETALRALKEWLKNSTSEGKTRVVTGGPGSGKSAILAWLVASSDPEIRCLPDAHALKFSADGLAPGTIDCAVHLRNKTLAEVTTQIALRFGFTAIAEKALGQTGTNAESTAALLAGELIRRERKTVILADALDESLDAQMITRALLSPLTGCGHIWFLIGSRPQNVPGSGPILPALGPSVLEVDLDREPYADKDDVRNYVKHRLLAVFEPGVTTPYRNQPELAQTVAEGVAARVKTSFLIARLVARDLLSRGSTVDTKTTDWQSQFPEEVNAALANDLAQFDREPMSELRKQDVIDLLEPLAYAQGAGLPIDLWPDVASASAGKEIRARDVRALLERAPYYLVAGGSRDLPSYRPFHQALVDFLRRPGRERTVHRAIVEAAIRNIPKLPSQSRNWQKAHFYALAHLATHAAACDMLDELLSEPGFITAGAPRSVLLSFDAAKEKVSQRMAKAYELVAHLIPGELPGNRASYLQLAAIQLGFPEVVSAFRDLDLTRSWYPAWARWSAVAPHRVIARHDSLAAVAAGRFEGRPILATGARGQVPIIFWDAETGEPVAAPPAPNAQATAEFLLWTELDDQPLVVAAGHEGTVWAMRPSGVLVWAVPP
ncbi:MAG: caspase family protein, partial [Bryobacteraceae bacterium]